MPSAASPYESWIGRQQHSSDVVAAGPVDRLAATLDRDDPPAREGDPVPPLAHWLLFLPGERQSLLGPDGHAARGDFLPPVHDLPRRMWAGSRLAFPGALRIGMRVRRVSTITSIKQRDGATGRLVFVTVRHDISAEDGIPLVIDEHDIVYRGLQGSAARAAPAAPANATWRREVIPDATLLFRYSALTFNGHRIHYDRRYVTEVEGYPGLIVHGPLIATLLLDLLRRSQPDSVIRQFSFRAVSPVFDGAALRLHGTAPNAGRRVHLWASSATGSLAMDGEAMIA